MDRTLELLARTDVYLVDQILRGRVAPGSRVIDVGCGGGRNLPWFAANGYGVVALDPRPEAFAALRETFDELGLDPDAVWTIEGTVEDADLPVDAGDLVLCNAVLHFAPDDERFTRMLDATWRLVAPGGTLFVRLATTISVEDRVRPLGGGRYALPAGQEWFLVDEARLLAETERLGATLLDPIKTTNVQGERAMTTWVLGRA